MMPSHKDIRIIPFTPDEMFAVVADIERYPDFVPGCKAIQILEQETDSFIKTIKAKMLVAYGVFSETYTSIVTLNKIERTIDAQHIEGPFGGTLRQEFPGNALGAASRPAPVPQ